MISVLTGDIINSQGLSPEKWLIAIKDVLNKFVVQPKLWELYRGDSFQVEIAPEKALELAIRLKLAVKQFENIDVRIAIGIGDKTYNADKITESNGSAFVNSGICFEHLKKKSLAIKTANFEFDYTLNTMFQLALLTMNNWTINSVKLLQVALDHSNKNQKEIALLLGKSQSTISEGLKRGGYDELLKLLTYYKYKVKNTKW